MHDVDTMAEANGPIVLRGRAGSAAQDDMDETLRLLREMQGNAQPVSTLRAYSPLPTMAFSRRESLLPGFTEAEACARGHGFEPVIRLAGGRAVAYDETCVVIDLLTQASGHFQHTRAFEVAAGCFRDTLRGLGADARIGAVPGEYCAGEHSVNARGTVKLVGIAQRVVRGARLVTASIVLGPAEPLRDVVDEVYRIMGLPWDPATFGSMADEGAPRSVDELSDFIVQGLSAVHTEWASPFR
ncbi:lipoyl protein ligase domain-containing protein [Cryobacterium psychrophilum]|uniref:Lipoate--protein ligase family protein n=1 Tax=Cryobacterium psychrophilum TaxID=41988 RepID=A0A4Y8KNR6_9MICO|nr:lipoate--protein ligase family protein [Cryobacterium psychrophilum]TFD78638.1 lipoate--protein ligase family protein [Cryobacterium psychrophilum]